MTVTLSKRTEEIVQTQLKSGRYATPDEVVNHLIEELSGATSPEFPSSTSTLPVTSPGG